MTETGAVRTGPPGALARLPGRVPPLVADAALAAALFLVTLGPGRVANGTGFALQTALVLPLVWRRRAPRAVFGVIAAAALAQWLLGVQLPADAALLVALGTVTARAPYRSAWAAALVAVAGAVLAAARWAPEGRFPASAAAMTAAVAASALLGANARIRWAARAERLARLELDRDERERRAVEEERARIARELHDSVTHGLSVVVALADALGHARPADASAVTARIAETGRQALTDMRRALGLLQEAGPDAGPHTGPGDDRRSPPGIGQLRALCEQMEAAGLVTRLRVDGEAAGVPAAAQLTVHRLVQESLTNALRHAPQGSRAEVRVSCAPGAVTVEVTDDGRAAGTGRPGSAGSGRGLAGMRERAAAFGGVLEAGPRPGGGWRVFVRLDPGGAP
ncbi:sensor histidine kinase [Kitasatospora xanthocidica]|uniref:histidine kinase n=1 Tax=Kitasatospora xanthocidica TaxID=83382 RepID=A0A372ZKQ3_9ACTN|nr:histidine kinase [Kitasatospora xanthocidica]RGD56433.1 sensor histidine kinase [Kitasatospora xanthocidica]